jgi:hypothetical protein
VKFELGMFEIGGGNTGNKFVRSGDLEPCNFNKSWRGSTRHVCSVRSGRNELVGGDISGEFEVFST